MKHKPLNDATALSFVAIYIAIVFMLSGCKSPPVKFQRIEETVTEALSKQLKMCVSDLERQLSQIVKGEPYRSCEQQLEDHEKELLACETALTNCYDGAGGDKK